MTSQTVSTEAADELIQRIGGMILADEEYQSKPWQAISLIVALSDGVEDMHGYRYLEDGGFNPSLPDDRDDLLFDLLGALRSEMASDGKGSWQKCLIQISRPGPEINMTFEYDDPDRWKPYFTGLDATDYANSVKPA